MWKNFNFSQLNFKVCWFKLVGLLHDFSFFSSLSVHFLAPSVCSLNQNKLLHSLKFLSKNIQFWLFKLIGVQMFALWPCHHTRLFFTDKYHGSQHMCSFVYIFLSVNVYMVTKIVRYGPAVIGLYAHRLYVCVQFTTQMTGLTIFCFKLLSVCNQSKWVVFSSHWVGG